MVLIGLVIVGIILLIRKLFLHQRAVHQDEEGQQRPNYNPDVIPHLEAGISQDYEVPSAYNMEPAEENKIETNKDKGAKQTLDQVAKQSDCPICSLSLFKQNEKLLATLPCGHLFHADCIEEWIDKRGNNMCPLDRKLILKHEITRLII